MSGKHAVLTLVCVKFSFSPKLSRPNWLMVTGDSSSSNIVSISPIDFSKFHCLYYWMIFWRGQLTKKGSQCALVVKLGEGEVLTKENDLPSFEAARDLIKNQFPTFHLENKVTLEGNFMLDLHFCI